MVLAFSGYIFFNGWTLHLRLYSGPSNVEFYNLFDISCRLFKEDNELLTIESGSSIPTYLEQPEKQEYIEEGIYKEFEDSLDLSKFIHKNLFWMVAAAILINIGMIALKPIFREW